MEKAADYIFLYTVKDLMEYLKGIPENTPLASRDFDLGGYDVSTHDFVNPYYEDGKLILGHHEYTAWHNNKDIYEKYFSTKI